MRRTVPFFCVLFASLAGGIPFAYADNDAVLGQLFALWDHDGRVTLETVRDLYSRHVVYYGQPMSADEVYANKRAFIRRWPSRRYSVVPGSSSERCDREKMRCDVDVTLAWEAHSPARGADAGGLTRVSLALVREDGAMKISRESGNPAGRRQAFDR